MRSVGLLMMVCSMSAVAGDIDEAAQRQRIAQERSKVEATYRDEQARCAQRFNVNSCVDEARQRRRAALERLEHERAVLNDMERKRRASERARRIEQKQSSAEARPLAPLQVKPRASSPGASEPGELEPAKPKPRSQATEPHRVAEADYKKRLKEAQAHRETVEQRNADRAERRPPSATLPAPSAASR